MVSAKQPKIRMQNWAELERKYLCLLSLLLKHEATILAEDFFYFQKLFKPCSD